MSMQCIAIQLAEGSHIGSKHQHMLHCNTAACINKVAANLGGTQAASCHLGSSIQDSGLKPAICPLAAIDDFATIIHPGTSSASALGAKPLGCDSCRCAGTVTPSSSLSSLRISVSAAELPPSAARSLGKYPANQAAKCIILLCIV